jgi:hypothetical protein
LWFYGLLVFANSQEGVDGRYLERHVGITDLAAFRMAQRATRHMAELERAVPIAATGQDIDVRVKRSIVFGQARAVCMLPRRWSRPLQGGSIVRCSVQGAGVFGDARITTVVFDRLIHHC